MMKSCYKIDPAAALITVTSVTGVYVGASNSMDYSFQQFSLYTCITYFYLFDKLQDEECNLDEASGKTLPHFILF